MQSLPGYAWQPALLAALAFAVTWIMTDKFDDSAARMVLAMAFASYVAVGSGITGFLLEQIEGQEADRRQKVRRRSDAKY
jgi:hypothetical protein